MAQDTPKKVCGGVACGTHSLLQKLCNVAFCVCTVDRAGHTHTHKNKQVIWLLASLSRHHIEAQRECVTDPHSEREGWQDGYRNMHCVSCVLDGFESTQCIFLTQPPLHSPHWLLDWISPSLLWFRSLLFSLKLWRGSLIGWGDSRVTLTDPKIQYSCMSELVCVCMCVWLFRVCVCVCVCVSVLDGAMVRH